MKKFLTVLCMAVLFASPALAKSHHHHGGHPAPAPYYHSSHHHHHHDHVGTGIAVGLIGGTIINALLQPRVVNTTTYTPVAYATTPTVITPPTVVTSPAVVTPTIITGQSCYTNTNIVTGAVTSNCVVGPATIY